MTDPMPHICHDLRANLAALPEQDRRFASSLLAAWDRGYLSDKQAYWVRKLHLRATTPISTEPVGDLAPMQALFGRARAHLKAPAIVFGTAQGPVRLSMATDRSRYPGSINVTTPGTFYGRVWYGRIHTDGRYEPSSRGDQPAGLVEALRAFAADPAGEAAKHGHLTGACCFCNRPLSDERSTHVGYGPVCAERWGLAWGAH